jgi:parallel beta-helix repeat protein
MKKMLTFITIIIYLYAGFRFNHAFTADTNIHITEEGIVGTDSIIQDGNIYKLTETIRKPIVIEINDIVLDGDGNKMEMTTAVDGIMITSQSGITIQNLRITTAKVGIILRDASECIIKDNTIERSKADGIRIKDASTYNTISGNTITESGDEGIYIIDDSDSNTIAGNTLSNNDSDGIDIEDCGNQIIYGNIITKDGAGEGIEISNSNNNYIFFNTVSQAYSGIQIKETCSNNMIFKNTFNNNEYGIRIDGSNDNRIYENELAYNKFSGIAVDFCTNNHFYRNEIHNNLKGIDFNQGQQNFIYNNNFVDNIDHTKYDAEVNVWFLDHPVGGNYWSDYEGVDENNDGFGDERKVLKSIMIAGEVEIDEENLDEMPLMQPIEINKGKEQSEITVMVPEESAKEGDSIRVSGELKRTYEFPTTSENPVINLIIKKPSGQSETIPITITDGTYEYEYDTEMPGSYLFSVDWEGNMFYEGGASDEFEFLVEEEVPPPKKTKLSTPSLDSDFLVGDRVKVSGKLTTEDDEVIPNADVSVQLYLDDKEVGQSNIVKTDSAGNYDYSYTIDEEGRPYKIGVKYDGSEPHYLSTSEVFSRDFQISIPESEPEPEPPEAKGGFPWWILLLLLILIAAGYYYYRRTQEQEKE